MRTFTLLGLSALLATGCPPENGLRALPNSAPIAVAAIYESDGPGPAPQREILQPSSKPTTDSKA